MIVSHLQPMVSMLWKNYSEDRRSSFSSVLSPFPTCCAPSIVKSFHSITKSPSFHYGLSFPLRRLPPSPTFLSLWVIDNLLFSPPSLASPPLPDINFILNTPQSPCALSYSICPFLAVQLSSSFLHFFLLRLDSGRKYTHTRTHTGFYWETTPLQ